MRARCLRLDDHTHARTRARTRTRINIIIIPQRTMFSDNHASVGNWITQMYENDVDEIDRIHASVLFKMYWNARIELINATH